MISPETTTMSPVCILSRVDVSSLLIKSIGTVDKRSNIESMPISDSKVWVFEPTPFNRLIL